MTNDYLKYRGKCKEFCEQALKDDPSLRLVRGFYYCPVWNKEEQHWWTERPDGTIFDPTKDQFGSRGTGTYREFDGTLPCAECGKIINELEIVHMGNYQVCSSKCAMSLVGLSNYSYK